MAAPADGGPAPAGPADGGPAAAGPGRRRRWRGLAEVVITLIAALVLALVVRTFVFQTFWIPSASMVPTLAVKDRIVVQKAFFSWHDLHAGDIVVFSHPPLDDCPGPQEGDLVKRVIALPGQTIYSSGSRVYLDGRPRSRALLAGLRPAGAADREPRAPLPGAAGRALPAGRQPGDLLRQPL